MAGIVIKKTQNRRVVIGSGNADMKAIWGHITGNIEDQADLMEILNKIIDVSNLTTDLAGYTDIGEYVVCRSGAGGIKTMYTLVVSKTRTGPTLTTLQTLCNKDGYQTRTKTGDAAWTEWVAVTYATGADIDALRPLIFAGL